MPFRNIREMKLGSVKPNSTDIVSILPDCNGKKAGGHLRILGRMDRRHNKECGVTNIGGRMGWYSPQNYQV